VKGVLCFFGSVFGSGCTGADVKGMLCFLWGVCGQQECAAVGVGGVLCFLWNVCGQQECAAVGVGGVLCFLWGVCGQQRYAAVGVDKHVRRKQSAANTKVRLSPMHHSFISALRPARCCFSAQCRKGAYFLCSGVDLAAVWIFCCVLSKCSGVNFLPGLRQVPLMASTLLLLAK